MSRMFTLTMVTFGITELFHRLGKIRTKKTPKLVSWILIIRLSIDRLIDLNPVLFSGFNGDNDPVDVCEIGSKVQPRGGVIKVKVLGCFALIDEGETDWKIIVIDVEDPLADQLNDIEDVNKLMPGLLQGTHEWFKVYKIPDGKPANEFAFKGQAKDRNFALKVIEETHVQWKELIGAKVKNSTGLSLKNVTLSDNGDRVENADKLLEKAPVLAPGQPLSTAEQQQVDKWHFITI